MALTTEQLDGIWRALQRYMTHRQGEFPYEELIQADGRAALQAVADHIEADKPSYVAALPEPFKGNSNAALKALFFMAISLAEGSQYISGDLSYVRNLLGRTD